jgi:hypothetical protein
MPSDPSAVFSSLKPILAKYQAQLAVKTDTPTDYTVVGKAASPFPQHKGQPLHFGAVLIGKAYVSFHLMPLYMCKPLTDTISPALRKRMQGKTCFNFKTPPEAAHLAELERLTAAGFEHWAEKKWL